MSGATIVYRKTSAGLAEMQDRRLDLPRKTFSLLLAIDGRRTREQLCASLSAYGDVARQLDELEGLGLIESLEAVATRPGPDTRSGGRATQRGRGGPRTDPGPGTLIGPGTVTGPPSVMGPRTRMGPDTVAGPRTRMGPDTAAGPRTRTGPDTIAGPRTRTGPDTVSGPRTRMRPETVAGPGTAGGRRDGNGSTAATPAQAPGVPAAGIARSSATVTAAAAGAAMGASAAAAKGRDVTAGLRPTEARPTEARPTEARPAGARLPTAPGPSQPPTAAPVPASSEGSPSTAEPAAKGRLGANLIDIKAYIGVGASQVDEVSQAREAMIAVLSRNVDLDNYELLHAIEGTRTRDALLALLPGYLVDIGNRLAPSDCARHVEALAPAMGLSLHELIALIPRPAPAA